MQVQEDYKSRDTRRHPGLSRHFWELKADQVLNKVFDQQQADDHPSTNAKAFTDIEILNFQSHGTPATNNNNTQQTINPGSTSRKLWLTLGIASAAALLLALIHLATEQQRSLVQAHNLRLLGQLREDSLRGSQQGNQNNQTINVDQPTSSSVPPSPPDEEWIEELAKLPPSETRASDLLKVPLNGTLQAVEQPRSSTQTTIGTVAGNKILLPQLLGIIQGAGTRGAAIIQWDGTSANVNIGEAIGTSGWLLRSTYGESAIIERGGVQRRISITAGG
jgi:hypothetical protein